MATEVQGTVPVRLSQNEMNAILNAVQVASNDLVCSWTTICLFGSRANMGARGGDIDLYIKLTSVPKLGLSVFKQKVLLNLYSAIGEQKIDLVIDDGVQKLDSFLESIGSTMVALWIKK